MMPKQVGGKINGLPLENFGTSTWLSEDGSRLVVGGTSYSANAVEPTQNGVVRVYQLIENVQ